MGRPRNPVITRCCKQCGSEFNPPAKEVNRGNGLFCSHTCFGKYRSEHKKAPIPNCVCAWCKKPFYKNAHRLKKSKHGYHFCCRECKDKAQRIENGFSAIHPPHYGDGASVYKDRVIRERGYECEVCGYDAFPVHEVHHLDCDRSNGDDSNLLVVCPTCHQVFHYTSRTGRYHWKN